MSEPPSEEQANPEEMTAQSWRAEVAAMAEVLTTKEVAVILRMTPKTVRTLATQGHIDGAVRMGKEWRFSKRKVLAQLQIRDPAEEESGGE